MKARSLGLAVLLLAGVASSAFAQERRRGGHFEPTPRALPAAPAAREAPRAAEARPAPQGWENRRQGGGERRDPRALEGPRPDANPGAGRSQSSVRSWRGGWGEQRGLEASRRELGGERTPPPAPADTGPRVIHRGESPERPDRPDRHRRGDDWPRGDRWGRNDGGSDLRWNDGRHVRPDRLPTWQAHRYPPVYTSHSRHRGHVWVVPPGYYVHSWRYGEYLPSAWYAPNYYVLEWWLYDLPEPPYGYEWVRVGADAVLVDVYNGRVVQVVRLAFW
jgi:Ni/Co efflux regulator RcnB